MNCLNKELSKEAIKWLRTYGYTLNNGEYECEKIKENLKRFYPYEYYFFVDLEVRNQVFKIFEGEEHTKEFYKSWNRRFRNERRILIKDLYGLEKKGIR